MQAFDRFGARERWTVDKTQKNFHFFQTESKKTAVFDFPGGDKRRLLWREISKVGDGGLKKIFDVALYHYYFSTLEKIFMDCFEAEKKLCDFLSSVTGFSADRQIFAGKFPPDIPEGICAGPVEGRPASLNDVNHFSVTVKGVFLSRAERRRILDLILSSLPAYGAPEGFLSIAADPEKTLILTEENDRFSFVLTLCVSFI